MPPKNKVTKEQLIDVAFNIAASDGFSAITIRRVAQALKCSIAPIYVNFKDVEELKLSVFDKIHNINKKILSEQNSGDRFLDIGITNIKFAKQYPQLFKDFFFNSQSLYQEKNKGIENDFIEEMKKNDELSTISEDELRILLLKMKIFQAGLSVFAANNSFFNILTEENMIKMLNEAGNDMLNGMITRQKKKEVSNHAY